MTDCSLGREQKCLPMRRFLTLYMTVNWHREFAVNFATFLKVCHDFFTFAPWFSYSPTVKLLTPHIDDSLIATSSGKTKLS